jgi:uncharacterized membrane protein
VNPTWLRPALVAASLVSYALLQHYANTRGMAPLGAALAVLPLLSAWLLMARRTSRPLVSLSLAALAAGLLLGHSWPRIERSYPLMFMLQEVGVYLTLAAAFGRSLARGQAPLCTRWATMLHGPLPAPVERYTRTVTLAWTLFFVAISLTSAALYFAAPLRVWSFFSNFLTLPLAMLMFAIEYEVRRHRLPWMQRAGIAATARAYFATMRNGTATRS